MNSVSFHEIEKTGFQLEPASPMTELSFAQKRIWFVEQLEREQTTYSIPMAMELRGRLNIRALEQSIATLVQRHDSLRTVFAIEDGQPYQRVSEAGSWTMPVIDLLDEPNARAKLDELLRKEVAREYDLEHGPLFRVQLYRIANDHFVLFLAMHHIVSDGWSMGILFRELGETYHRLCRHEPPALPPLNLSYRDFTRWQNNWLRGENLAKLTKHWRSKLADAPQVLDLFADRPRPAVRNNYGATHTVRLPNESVEPLRQLALQERGTLFMPLFACFAILISRYSRQKDLLIGTPIANRNQRHYENIIGCFVNNLILRTTLAGAPTCREFIRQVRQVCLDAFQHQDMPFERLVEELKPVRDLSRNPLVQVMFSLENMPLQPLQLTGLSQNLVELERKVTQTDITLRVQETAGGLNACFEYSTELFDAATIERMASHWCNLVVELGRSPETSVSELPMLSTSERKTLLIDWNNTTTSYPASSSLGEIIELQVKRSPAAIALICENQRLSYQEVSERSNQLANYLTSMGLGPGKRVGICLERSSEMVVALLGILKNGAAYVPLDPTFPQDRLRFIANDAQLSAVISTSFLVEVCGLPRDRQVLFDLDGHLITAFPTSIKHFDARPEDPAYVIYTSGSTGRPKGVVVPQRAVVNFLESMAHRPGLNADDVMVAVTTLSFDIAVLELLLPLTVGAQVVMANREQALDGQALASLIEKHQATVMQATPVTWRMILESAWSPKRLFKALVGGEPLPKPLAEQLLLRNIELWNMYGPTETTVWSTCAHIINTKDGISIGRPIANTIVYILDEAKQLCPAGVPGELFIGGDGLSLGYWNKQELTAARFIHDPFTSNPSSKLYATGDLAVWRRDGNIEHLGRLDHQIKLRGFRIEPGEIEATLTHHPAVKEAVVIPRADNSGSSHLVAYFVAHNPPSQILEELRSLARSTLPEYMTPTFFVQLPAIPRTPNGKLDRDALPAPAREQTPKASQATRALTATEEMVVTVYRGILEQENINADDNFFDLGGHSLMAARLMLQLRNKCGFDLPMKLLFEHPTPAGLAQALDGLVWLKKSTPPVKANISREQIDL